MAGIKPFKDTLTARTSPKEKLPAQTVTWGGNVLQNRQPGRP